jgi:HK97 gp10 family phage protein
MQLNIKIDPQMLFQAFDKIGTSAAKEMRVEMKKALRTVADDARMHHRFREKSGSVERSIRYDVSGSGLAGRVFLDTGISKHAEYVHEGTRPHPIPKPGNPRNRKALYWVSGGKAFFARSVKHPGTKPDPFLTSAVKRQEPYIVSRMQAAVKRVIEMAGIK